MEPLSALAIATLAFIGTKAAETAVGKLTEAAMEKVNQLRRKITDKLSSNPSAEVALLAAQEGSEADLEAVSEYLQAAMDEDPQFAQEVSALATEIKNLNQVEGENWQVFGGEVNYTKDNKSPVIQGGSGHNITFNIGNNSDH